MNTLIFEKEFPHPPAKVWRALTDPKILALWLLENDFEPSVGRKFTFRTKPMPQWNGIVDSEVLTIDPQKSLSYAWNVGDEPAGFRTVVTWTLTPTGGGTHLRLEHAGFRPDQKANAEGARFGWQAFLSKLEATLANSP